MTQPLRLVFAGTPAFAQAHLAALLDSHHEVLAVFTQPDRRAGRGKQLQPSPVKALAQQHDIPVHQPTSLNNDAARELLAGFTMDAMVVVAYGLLLPPDVLTIPRLGCINVHASLLPRWRGAAPVERAIMAGDTRTGVSIMQMAEGLDTGPVLSQSSTTITPTDDGASLSERLTDQGRQLLVESLDALATGNITARPQDEGQSCYAPKLGKEEAAIDWHDSAEAIRRRIKALYPRMPAFTLLGEERIRLADAQVLTSADNGQAPPGTIVAAGPEGLDVLCGDGQLRITRLQLPGKNPVTTRELLNAHQSRFAPGQRLGSQGAKP